MEKFRWAVVGTGYIANNFAQGMQEVKDAELTAVVSRNKDTADKFAKTYNGKATFTDFDVMLSEVKPDAVYLGIPNDLHYEYILKALKAGIHVLSEKPIVDTTKQLEEVYALAEEKGLFLLEGMWTRFFPTVKKVREWIGMGRIGKPLSVNVSFDIQPDYSDWQVWKAGIEHSGSALRDVGIYSLGVANMVFPSVPEHVSSAMHSNGEVDDMCRLLVDYGEGRTAMLGGAFNQDSDHTAHIVGSEGRITFGPEFWHPSEAVLVRCDGTEERFKLPYAATGFQYEIMGVQEAIRASKKECVEFSHTDSRVIAKIIEDTRKSWGIYYKADMI